MSSKNFVPFGNMTDINPVYISTELFPIFANRVMNERRPEFQRYSDWSDMRSPQLSDPLLLMARMGGSRATDTLQVYPVPEKREDGLYRTSFFCHGLSHMPSQVQEMTHTLVVGQQLFPMFDVQNPFDHGAVALRTSDPASMIGYCPRYLAPDLKLLAGQSSNSLAIRVQRVNHDAPVQFRLLCEAVSKWPKDFSPCDDDDHRTIPRFTPEDIVRAAKRQSAVPKRHIR